MANRDIRSNLKQSVSFSNIAANGDTQSTVIDSFEYESGVMFGMFASNYTDGTFQITAIQESDESGSGFTDIDLDKVIGNYADTSLSAANTDLVTLGCFSTKRYLRVTINASGVTTGSDIAIVATVKGDNLPVA